MWLCLMEAKHDLAAPPMRLQRHRFEVSIERIAALAIRRRLQHWLGNISARLLDAPV